MVTTQTFRAFRRPAQPGRGGSAGLRVFLRQPLNDLSKQRYESQRQPGSQAPPQWEIWACCCAANTTSTARDPDWRKRYGSAAEPGTTEHTHAFVIHALACLAADLGDRHRAAMLHGAAQAMLDKTGHRWDASDTRYRQESLDKISAALGEEHLQQALANGMALSFDRAIDLALDKAGGE